MNDIVAEADGDSVTVEKLTGDKKYFPDASELFDGPFSREGEIPHHVFLLTKNNGCEILPPQTTDGTIAYSSTYSSVVLTNEAMYLVDSNSFTEFRYGAISSLLVPDDRDDGSFIIRSGGERYVFNLAYSGDAEFVTDGLRYLRTQLAAHA